MVHSRSFLIGAIAGFSLALVAVGFASCQSDRKDDSRKAAPGAPAQTDAELTMPVAQVDDVTITVGELQQRINRQSPYVRARYASQEQKKEFLETMIRFEVLAKEASRRGLDRDKEVVRTMKQVMIQKLIKAEFEAKIKPEDITDEEMKTFYKENEGDYNKPEEMRVSAIILDSKSTAERVAKEAKGPGGSNNKGFRDLVDQYSVDETTKMRGGDLRYFSRTSTEVPRPVIDAAFSLVNDGDVAGPIEVDRKHYIIKRTGKRKAVNKGFDEVKRQIQNRVYRDKRTRSQSEFVKNLKKNAKIKVYNERLKKVQVDTSTSSVVPGGAAGSVPAFPGGAKAPQGTPGAAPAGGSQPAHDGHAH